MFYRVYRAQRIKVLLPLAHNLGLLRPDLGLLWVVGYRLLGFLDFLLSA